MVSTTLRTLSISILALAAAAASGCGNGRQTITGGPDATRPDYPSFVIPTAEPTATPAPVSVQVFAPNGGVAAGVPVVLGAPDGSLAGQGLTDDSGSLAVPVPAGGSITVANMQPGETAHLQTVLGVSEGMTTTFGSFVPDMATGSELVHVTFFSDAEGAGSYDVYTGCTSGPTTTYPGSDAWITLDPACNPADVTVLAIARDWSNLPIAYAWIEHVSVPAGGSVDVTTPAWRTDFTASSVVISGAPAGSSWLSGSLILQKNGGTFPIDADIQGAPDASAPMTVPFVVPPLASGDRIVLATALSYDDGCSGATVERGVTSVGGSIPVDLDTDLLPHISAATLDVTDSAHPALSWTAPTGAIAPQAVSGFLTWTDTNYDAWDWTSLAVPSNASAGTVLPMPTMPSALAGSTRSSGFSPATIVMMERDGSSFASFASADGWTPVPASGSYVFRTSWRSATP